MKRHSGSKKGTSLLELVIYLSIMLVLLAVLVKLAVSFSGTYRTIKVSKNLDSAAVSSMERMTRDIRNATNHTATSTSAEITLTESASPASVRFYVASGVLKVDENGSYAGPLIPLGVTVTSLVFRQITTAKSKGVKIEMTLSAAQGSTTRTRKFYDTVELRGSY